MKITLVCDDIAMAANVVAALSKFPYEQVAPTVESFRKQIADQVAASQKSSDSNGEASAA